MSFLIVIGGRLGQVCLRAAVRAGRTMPVHQFSAGLAHLHACCDHHECNGRADPAEGVSDRTTRRTATKAATAAIGSRTAVRQHATSVYQKATLAGRAELAAFFLEDVILPH